MKCSVCGCEIPEARLKALPKTTTCVQHSGVSRVAGYPVITGKTTYSELIIASQDKIKEIVKDNHQLKA